MKQEGLSAFTDLHLTLIAFFLFVFSFALIIYWYFKITRIEDLDHVSRLPLDQKFEEDKNV